MEKDKHSGYLSEQSDNNLISAAVQEYEELLAQE